MVPPLLCGGALWNTPLKAAGGRSTTVLASYVTGGVTCAAAAAFGSGKDPIPAPPWRIERDDMGVDASAPTGTPIYATAPSTLAQVIGDWFEGEPLLLFKFDTPQTGTPYGDQYWYLAEQIIPVTTTIGTTFATGQAVAHYAPAGTGIEIGWGHPPQINEPSPDKKATPRRPIPERVRQPNGARRSNATSASNRSGSRRDRRHSRRFGTPTPDAKSPRTKEQTNERRRR